MKRPKQGGEHVRVQHPVAELKIAKAVDNTALPENTQVGVECDLSQDNDNLKIREQLQFAFKERTAIAQLIRCGVVVRRRTMCRGCDPRIVKLKTVFGVAAFLLRGEAGTM